MRNIIVRKILSNIFNCSTINELIPFDAEEEGNKKKEFKKKFRKYPGKSMNAKNPNITIIEEKKDILDDNSFIDPASFKNVIETLTKQMKEETKQTDNKEKEMNNETKSETANTSNNTTTNNTNANNASNVAQTNNSQSAQTANTQANKPNNKHIPKKAEYIKNKLKKNKKLKKDETIDLCI